MILKSFQPDKPFTLKKIIDGRRIKWTGYEVYWLLLSAEKIKCLGVDKCFGFTFLAWIGGCGFYLWVPGVVSAADGVRDVAKRSATIYEEAEETESELKKVGWIIKKATMCAWCVLYESVLVVKL